MHRNLLSVGVAMALLTPTLSFAQLSAASARQLQQLPNPPQAADLSGLAERDSNAFVYFLQGFLRESGMSDTQPTGQLNSTTVGALLRFCRAQEIEALCERGPLLPESVAAISAKVAELLVPIPDQMVTESTDQPTNEPEADEPDAAEAEPTAPEAPAATSAAAPEAPSPPVVVAEELAQVADPMLPEGWRISDNGGRGASGIAVTVVSAGATDATLHLAGTAALRGYVNIELSPMQPAEPGVWTASLTAAASAGGAEGGTGVVLRTAVYDEEAYLGELFAAVPLPVSSVATEILGSAELPSGATRLMPYAQLFVEQGAVVDITVRIAMPRLVGTAR